jgi:hypothetical protein
MNRRSTLIITLAGAMLIVGFVAKLPAAVALPQRLNRAAIEKMLGRQSTESESVLKLTFPRSDMHVSIDALPLAPGLALTSWVAFHPTKESSMVMGDLVLKESEVPVVMASLEKSGLRITALHNHLLRESPRVMYLHIEGEGDPVGLARRIRDALNLTNTPIASVSQPQGAPSIDWQPVEQILGRPGARSGTVLLFSIPRAETITAHGMAIPSAMGVAHVINLQAVGRDAATTGDFVLLASEVNPVIRALQESGIAVTAVHNHMLDESPRLFFLHFWGTGDPQRLARGLKNALDQTHPRSR